MKKKMLCFAVVLSFTFLISVSVYADYDWPPPVPDIPATVFTEDMMKKSFSGLKLSLQSMGDTGLQLQGVIISVLMISSIFYGILSNKFGLSKGMRYKGFNRKVKFLNNSKNSDSVVDVNVREIEINPLSISHFQLKRPSTNLNKKIYQRELAYQSNLALRDRHSERNFEENIYRKEINAKDGLGFAHRDREMVVEHKVQDEIISPTNYTKKH